MGNSMWGSDGLDHKYCTDEICCAAGTYETNVNCPKHSGTSGHDCNY